MVPQDSVLPILFKALDLVVSGKSGPDTPTVDAECSEEGRIVVTLVCYFGPGFAPVYKFPLNLEEVDKFDVLESQLRDAREESAVLREKLEAVTAKHATLEIEFSKQAAGLAAANQKSTRLEQGLAAANQELAMMKQQRKSFFNLSTTANPSAGSKIPWNGTSPRQLCDMVALSADNTTVTVLRAGLYQIHARIAFHNSSNNALGLSLRVNGGEVAAATHCDQSTYYGTVEVTELLSLQVNNTLEIYFTSGGFYNSQPASRFWGLFVSEL